MPAGVAKGIDWDQVVPERLRNVPAPTNINWDALHLVMERADLTPLQRQMQTKQLVKLVKKHGIAIMHPTFRASYVCARLALGDFSDYWGWEFRDLHSQENNVAGWAAEVYWNETWLPKWGGGYVDRLLVISEQGLGDAIFFASILPECLVRVKQVIYECDPRIHGLLERSLPGLECDHEYDFEERRLGDAFIPAAELMRMFRRNRSHFPGKSYLRPDMERVQSFDRYRGRTGISWRGRQGRLDPLALGIENPLSLQYNETHKDIEAPDIDLKDDIEGVVALCSVLERVVTVPTTVHHLAGAQGAKIEIIIPPEGSGEVINQVRWDTPLGKLPWYPDVQVYSSINEWKCRTMNRTV
jgi:hypothetical protein